MILDEAKMEELASPKVEFQSLLDLLVLCGKHKDIVKARKLHSHILENKLFLKNPCIHNAILGMYTKCGEIEEAQEVFEKLPIRNIVSWNTLISGYTLCSRNHEALDCFKRMIRDDGFTPNAVTFLCVLKACGSTGLLEAGQQIHQMVTAQRGLLRKNVKLGNALVDMYAKCGMIHKAQEVFHDLPVHDVISWNSLISGYAEHGLRDEALDCLMHMQHEGISPNGTTLVCLLKACHGSESLAMGEKIHSEAVKTGLLGKSVVLGNAIIDMYVKCNMLEKGKGVFEDELLERDTASWNTMINGYSRHGLDHEAVGLFLRMQEERLSPPNAITFVCVLKACGSIGALEMGEEIHSEVSKGGVIKRNIILGNALVDMYAKCGMLGHAQQVFDELPVRDTASWNALIAGYAQFGLSKMVFCLFMEMNVQNVVPDLITFLVLLNTCSHSGLVEEGQVMFDGMHDVYQLPPTVEHYACMVDLFSRAGYFEKAVLEIEKVSAFERLPLWWSLLGACSKWLNVEVGKWAFEQAVEVDQKCADTYICMRNIYAAAGMLNEAEKIEAERVKNKLWNPEVQQECLY